MQPIASPVRTDDYDSMNTLESDRLLPQPSSQEMAFAKAVQSLPPEERTRFEQYYTDASPEEQQRILETFSGGFGNKASDAQDAMSRSDHLRVRQPRGQNTRGIYTAANPLEHLGAFAMNAQASNLYNKGQGDLASAREGQSQGEQEFMKYQAGGGGPSRADLIRGTRQNQGY